MTEDKGLFANLYYALKVGMGIGGLGAVSGFYLFQGIQDMLGFTLLDPQGVAHFMFGAGLFMGLVMEYRKWFKKNKQ